MSEGFDLAALSVTVVLVAQYVLARSLDGLHRAVEKERPAPPEPEFPDLRLALAELQALARRVAEARPAPVDLAPLERRLAALEARMERLVEDAAAERQRLAYGLQSLLDDRLGSLAAGWRETPRPEPRGGPEGDAQPPEPPPARPAATPAPKPPPPGARPPATAAPRPRPRRSRREGMDGPAIFRQFVVDCCGLGPGRSAGLHELYSAYRAWCDAEGWTPLAEGAFTGQVAALGCSRWCLSNGSEGWQGIDLKRRS